MVLKTTRITLTEHARQRLTERLPDWTEEGLLRELRENSRVPGQGIFKRVNAAFRAQGKHHLVITHRKLLSRPDKRFYLALHEHGIFFVMTSPEPGQWVVITLWKYRDTGDARA